MPCGSVWALAFVNLVLDFIIIKRLGFDSLNPVLQQISGCLSLESSIGVSDLDQWKLAQLMFQIFLCYICDVLGWLGKHNLHLSWRIWHEMKTITRFVPKQIISVNSLSEVTMHGNDFVNYFSYLFELRWTFVKPFVGKVPIIISYLQWKTFIHSS